MEKYVDYVKNFIKDNLYRLENKSIYGGNISFFITEIVDLEETATFDKLQAMQYIKEWFFVAAEIYNYEIQTYKEIRVHPFKNPEKYMVLMLVEGVAKIIDNCKFIKECWNEEIVLTTDVIDSILAEVDKVEKIEF